MVGMDDEALQTGTVTFEVWVDGKKVADSGRMKTGDAPKRLQADLHGAKRLSLLVGDCDDGIDFDHADWAGAVLVLPPALRQRPQTTALPKCPGPTRHRPGRVARSRPSTARGSSAARRAGRFCFSFRPRAKSRSLCRQESARGPCARSRDRHHHRFAQAAGTTVVEMEVKNARGSAKRELTIVGGQHKLALTPPMGWNSWNCWAGAVSDAKVRAAADAMVSQRPGRPRLPIHQHRRLLGRRRDANGEIQTNQKFPDMKALADYVHGKGLKMGIYSSPGPKTCAGFEASYKHEAQDAATYAQLGRRLPEVRLVLLWRHRSQPGPRRP